MTFRLLPKDVKFFGMFIEDGENLELAAGRLREMVDHFDRLDERKSCRQVSWRFPMARTTPRRRWE
jgi:hypothetical protein